MSGNISDVHETGPGEFEGIAPPSVTSVIGIDYTL